MIESISGIVVAVVIIILALLLSKYFAIKLFAATNLVAILFIYVGFALKGNPINETILEIGFATTFFFVALFGYTRNNELLAYGIMLHGLWDILHYNGLLIKTDIPAYWPVFCFIIDIIDGLFFLFIFRREKTRIRALS